MITRISMVKRNAETDFNSVLMNPGNPSASDTVTVRALSAEGRVASKRLTSSKGDSASGDKRITTSHRDDGKNHINRPASIKKHSRKNGDFSRSRNSSRNNRRSNNSRRTPSLRRGGNHRDSYSSSFRRNGYSVREDYRYRSRRSLKRRRLRSSSWQSLNSAPRAPYRSRSSSCSNKKRSYADTDSDAMNYADDVGMYRGREGNYIDDEYRVLRTLGKGTFGRVVECRQRGSRYTRAIKVIRSIKKYVEEAKIEASILDEVQKVARRGGNGSRIVKLYDYFNWGSHYCLVFEPLGMSLYDYCKMTNYRLWKPCDVARVMCDIFSALAFLHSECYCVHTDIKLENVLFESNFHRHSSHTCPPSFRVKLIDFGGATFLRDGKLGSGTINTRQYRSPEVLLDRDWDFSSDVWSAGCLAVELIAGELLFQTHSVLHHLALIEATLGNFPEPMNSSGEFSSGKVRWPPKPSSSEFSARNIKRVYQQLPLERLIQQQYDIRGVNSRNDIEEKRFLLEFLLECLRINPSRRIKAQYALKLPFLKVGSVDS